jgi:DNA-binding response OmpR family regulator
MSFFGWLDRFSQCKQSSVPEQAAPATNEDPDAKRLVMVVEDDEQVRVGLSCVLELEGWDVISASGISEALDAIVRHSVVPDVLLVDFRLGESRDGVHAVSEIRRAVSRGVPAMILTGEHGDEVTRRAATLTIPVLRKPCGGRELSERLSSVLKGDKFTV